MYYAQNYAGIVGWSLARLFSILSYRFVFLVSLFLYNTETLIPISLFYISLFTFHGSLAMATIFVQ